MCGWSNHRIGKVRTGRARAEQHLAVAQLTEKAPTKTDRDPLWAQGVAEDGEGQEYEAWLSSSAVDHRTSSNMKVNELRLQLRSLGLSTGGLKADLAARLDTYHRTNQAAPQVRGNKRSQAQSSASEGAAAGNVSQLHFKNWKDSAGIFEPSVVFGTRTGPTTLTELLATMCQWQQTGSKRARPSQQSDRNGAQQKWGNRAQQLEQTFANYEDPAEQEINPDGMVRLCEDLGVELEDPIMIALSFVMKVSKLLPLQELNLCLLNEDFRTEPKPISKEVHKKGSTAPLSLFNFVKLVTWLNAHVPCPTTQRRRTWGFTPRTSSFEGSKH